MKIDGQQRRTIWFDEQTNLVCAIDQNKLPHQFNICNLESSDDIAEAIRNWAELKDLSRINKTMAINSQEKTFD